MAGLPRGKPRAFSALENVDFIAQVARGSKTMGNLIKEHRVARDTLVASGIRETAARVKATAARIAEVDAELASMPVSLQAVARSLAEDLKAVSANLASAAAHGSRSANHLSLAASRSASKVDPDADLADNAPHLLAAGAYTDAANRSAEVGLRLLSAVSKGLPQGPAEPPDAAAVPDEPALAPRRYLQMVRG